MHTQIPERALVFSLCENTIGSLAGYVGFLENKIVPLLLDNGMDAELLEQLIALYHPSYLWLPEAMKESFLKQKVHQNNTEVWRSRGYVLLKTHLAPYPLNDALALLLTTSGSTGSPKLVRQSTQNIQANAESIAEYLELTEAERPITSLPMNYTYGLSIINSHLLKGATLLMTTKSFMQKEFWQFLKSRRQPPSLGFPITMKCLNGCVFSEWIYQALKP